MEILIIFAGWLAQVIYFKIIPGFTDFTLFENSEGSYRHDEAENYKNESEISQKWGAWILRKLEEDYNHDNGECHLYAKGGE